MFRNLKVCSPQTKLSASYRLVYRLAYIIYQLKSWVIGDCCVGLHQHIIKHCPLGARALKLRKGREEGGREEEGRIR